MIPILEYGATCWDAFREEQINALEESLEKAAKRAKFTSVSNLEILAQGTKIGRIRTLYKAYTGEPARKAIGDSLQSTYYLLNSKAFDLFPHVRLLPKIET